MARDYAHQSGGSRRRSNGGRAGARARKHSGLPGWVWMVAGVSLGLAIAAFIYISRPIEQAAGPRGVLEEAAAVAPKRPAESAVTLPPKEKERFTFYDSLRKQRVVVPQESDSQGALPPPPSRLERPTTDTAPEAAAGGVQYVIQVASFSTRADAERQRASLALLGVEARVEAAQLDNGKATVYRVRIGPERDYSRVQSTLARLTASGLKPQVYKLQ